MKKKETPHNRHMLIGTAACVLIVVIAAILVLFALLSRPNELPDSEETTIPAFTEESFTEPDSTEPDPTEPEEELPDAQTLLAGMTQWEKIGQLFVVRPEMLVLTQPGTTENEAGFKTVTTLLEKSLAQYPVGGFAMFNRNLQSPSQITKFNADLQNLSKIP